MDVMLLKQAAIGLALLVAFVTSPVLGQTGADRAKDRQTVLATPVDFGLSDQGDTAWMAQSLVSTHLTDDAKPAPVPVVTPTPCVARPAPQTKELDKKVAGAYSGLFYNNNFGYLCDPNYADWHLGETLKRLGVGDRVIYDLGGQFRMRQQAERNMRGLGLTGRDDDFLLYRTRLYANVQIGKRFRLYAEMIDANSEYEDFLPRPIEVNRMDMLNLFADFVLLDADRGQLWGALAGRSCCMASSV